MGTHILFGLGIRGRRDEPFPERHVILAFIRLYAFCGASGNPIRKILKDQEADDRVEAHVRVLLVLPLRLAIRDWHFDA
jgi:hypothetical protein